MKILHDEKREQPLQDCDADNIPVCRQEKLLTISTKIKSVPGSDIHDEGMLGMGSFCCVHRIHINTTSSSSRPEKHVYALKCVRNSHTDDDDTASNDLINEAEILSSLSHKNIIRFHGTHISNDWGFCVILETLHETLEDRLTHWRYQKRHSFRIFTRKWQPKSDRFSKRSKVALDIANGMEYLHKKQIIMRDLKPANIGFNEHGTVRIFDFGLARHIGGTDSFHTDEQSGTLRYMAPEVMVPSNEGIVGLSSDVYSFGVLLWELCTLQSPYQCIARHCTASQFVQKVTEEQQRPSLRKINSGRVRKLVRQCWDGDASIRPRFDMIHNELKRVGPKLTW